MENDAPCERCGHPGWDHGGWLEERAPGVERLRPLGCRIVQCGCEGWKEREVRVDYFE